MTKFDMMRPAILQLSDQNTAYLIDLISLVNNQELDQVLCEVFTNKDTVCVGFSFQSDLSVFKKHLPLMKFYKLFTNFIDVQSYYSKVCLPEKTLVGLAKVAKHILNVEICKGEQMSNWEKRPLRLSQQHYAALDAYCLISILIELARIGAQETEQSIDQHMKEHINELKYSDSQSVESSKNEESKNDNADNAEDSSKYKKKKKRSK